MKTILLKLMNKETLSFESIYQNKGFAADAFQFSLIEPQRNRNRKKRFQITKVLKTIKRTASRAFYSSVLLFWFSVYFVVHQTIKAFTLFKL
ncbi:MAG: hypothetical protein IPN61_01110 [Bacteroidetes bacterium]|nr:hypothetical protein [Bacteroidota bacterium]MBK9412018.1 hypothetical protein [Bacteroidota bacterium]